MTKIEDCKTLMTVILPSLNPDEKFAQVVKGLLEEGFTDILIVNDGSAPENLHWFEQAAQDSRCHVLTHEVNQGKGRALKTAFAYVLANRPDTLGVITIDGDGQHLCRDIAACAERMLAEGDKVVLGCRDFGKAEGIPEKSLRGNRLTSKIFRIFCGIRLSDTQTGLRAIPVQYLPLFESVKGERFEYETNMLLEMKRCGVQFVEQPIATVYEDDNRRSHYRPVVDSLKIFAIILKFLLSSVSSCLLDLAMFYLAMRLLPESLGDYKVLVCTVAARAISSFFNFNMNQKVVFSHSGSYPKALLRYYCLCVPQMLVSALVVSLLNEALDSGSFLCTLIKLAVDTALFFISFGIQREWVFQSEKAKK